MSKFQKYCEKKGKKELQSMMADALEDSLPPESDLSKFKISPDEWFDTITKAIGKK